MIRCFPECCCHNWKRLAEINGWKSPEQQKEMQQQSYQDGYEDGYQEGAEENDLVPETQ